MVYVHGKEAVESLTTELWNLGAGSTKVSLDDESEQKFPSHSAVITDLATISILFDDFGIDSNVVDRLVEAVMNANLHHVYVKTIVIWGSMELAFTFLRRCISDPRNVVANFKFIQPESDRFNAEKFQTLTDAIQQSNKGCLKRLSLHCQDTSFENRPGDHDSFLNAVLDSGIESIHVGGLGGNCRMNVQLPSDADPFWKKMESNTTLQHINFSRTRMDSNSFIMLSKALVHNKGVRKVRFPQLITHQTCSSSSVDMYHKCHEALTQALRTNKTLTHVWLPNICSDQVFPQSGYILDRLQESDTVVQLLRYKMDPDVACLQEMNLNKLTKPFLTSNQQIPLGLYAKLCEKLNHRPVMIFHFLKKGRVFQQGARYDSVKAAEFTKARMERMEEEAAVKQEQLQRILDEKKRERAATKARQLERFPYHYLFGSEDAEINRSIKSRDRYYKRIQQKTREKIEGDRRRERPQLSHLVLERRVEVTPEAENATTNVVSLTGREEN
ncbi:hypothetical protein IV203_021313 [Nitzschia inconspicua]|uniref:Uncharacterized protein n=1 Tax=Nitzschia inconspicua TaxID=303405 RepID=A0A9K3KIC4_9STRA|nr:hypothetical protein IV203_021313 [Nitzschia inconspicua]